MSELSKQYHSINIGDKNTWDDWKLIPLERPCVAPPGVKVEYIDIPGADGSLDYSEALTGIKKTNRSGSWRFLVMNNNLEAGLAQKEWYDLYSTILNYIQGKKFQVILDDDPNFYYEGRLQVSEWSSSEDMYSTITFDYNFGPYKYPIDTTAGYDWLWDELFGNTIYYGSFDVDGEKWRNILNDSPESVSVNVTVTSDMLVEYDGETFNLLGGEQQDLGFQLKPGDNFMKFVGNGRVTVDYSAGRRL